MSTSQGRVQGSLMVAIFLMAVFPVCNTFSSSLSVRADVSTERDKQEETENKSRAIVTTETSTETDHCVLTVDVGNSSDQFEDYQLEWFFIAKRTSKEVSEELVVADSGRTDLQMDAKETIQKTIAAKPFVFTVKSINSELNGGGDRSRQMRSGDTYAGYTVLLKKDGHIVAKKSNSSRFLKDEWMDKYQIVPSKAKKKKK
ncbi:MAG: hypothetical protein AB7E95_01985 [Kiritimatiellales bacterium]